MNDNELVAYAGPGGILGVDLATSPPTSWWITPQSPKAKLSPWTIRIPVFSPDGQHIAFGVTNSDKTGTYLRVIQFHSQAAKSPAH